ncbi:BTB/POZ domain-containing protein 6-B-like [Paramacrobiotus metropolitanus]|uniref:BTB/POZ domain-containing protein 6-B-like n=1 Tax=Paramacrobiotus metropolitanus TaxID=2943436 RepID=UPI0024463A59|nr:BTB/POZ domain-containing protein 6-B-like [Paramacrobiotus metropolitanus]
MCLNSPADTSNTAGTATFTSRTVERRSAVGVLADRMKDLLANRDFSDVQFVVGVQFGPEKIFPAHKSILCSSSGVFYNMICNSVAETCSLIIHFPDIPSDAFASLLSYVYTDSVENINADNVFPTLQCADKFAMPFLADTCCAFIIQHVNADNCLTMLENAIRWSPDRDSIPEKCLEIVEASGDTILQSELFSSIGHDSLQMILQRSSLSADENTVYLAVEKWAGKACEKRNLGPSAANRREVLGAALFLVRFPL